MMPPIAPQGDKEGRHAPDRQFHAPRHPRRRARRPRRDKRRMKKVTVRGWDPEEKEE
jgi:hypothetical protein